MMEVSPKRKPLLPIIHNSKALSLATKEDQSQVRCFYALAHRGANPIDSEFHMLARLGFRRRNNNNVRLRPLDAMPRPDPAIVSKSSKRHGRKKNDASNSIAMREPQKRRTPSPPPEPRRPSERTLSDSFQADGRNSPESVFEDPLPEAGVTWTTFQKVTDETVGTVIHEALEGQDEKTKFRSSDGMVDKSPTKPLFKEEMLREKDGEDSKLKASSKPVEVDPAKEWKNQAKSKAAELIKPTSSLKGQARKTQQDAEDLPELSTFSSEDAAQVTKIQAAARGQLARKHTREQSQKQVAAQSLDPVAAAPNVQEETPALISANWVLKPSIGSWLRRIGPRHRQNC
jgi:hypothetical protein